jgi:hypothetical protein
MDSWVSAFRFSYQIEKDLLRACAAVRADGLGPSTSALLCRLSYPGLYGLSLVA